MALGNFFKRLVGGDEPPPLKPIVPAPKPTAPPAPAPTPKPAGAILQREEMLDAKGRLSAYRFSFRVVDERLPVAPGAYLAALHAANVKAFAERRTAVISVHLNEWLREDFAALISANTVFQINVPPTLAVTEEWLEGLRRIRAAGAGVALSRVEASTAFAPALALANLGFVDYSAYGLEGFERVMKALRTNFPQMALAVEQVRSWPERRLCVAAGAGYALGDFLAAADEEEKGEKLNQSRLVLIEMLNLLRKDGDTEALTAVAKRDPGVAVHILSMANSPVSGLASPVTGLDQAILVLGREMLYRWLAVSMFRAGAASPRDEALLEVALGRARFLELAGLAVGSKAEADELFLVGLLSFVDVLLGTPMAAVVGRMNLSQPVQDVLLRSEGPYSRHLMMALAMEKGQAERATQLAGAIGLDAGQLDAFRGEAQSWAVAALGQPS